MSKTKAQTDQKARVLITKNFYKNKVKEQHTNPLKLLLAFLEDLVGLRMDTKTEKAQVKLAEETILELLQDMDGILKIANRMSYIFYIGNWIARRKLKKRYKYYDRMLWLPILHKNICDFKFI